MALKPPPGFCGLSRTRFRVGLVLKSAAPLREESVAVFKSRVAASEGPSLRGAWERPFKPQTGAFPRFFSQRWISHTVSRKV